MFQGLILGIAVALIGADDPPDDPAYQAARASAGRDADAQVRLALWCEARGLDSLRRQHLRLAVELEPDHPLAWRLLGRMDDGGEWRTPAQAVARARGLADRADALARYDLRREQVADTPQAHWNLALWCEQAGLSDEAGAHLQAVVRLDPSREEAWKKLGARKQGGRWVTPDQLAAERLEADARRKAEARWRPRLAKWKGWLGLPTRRAEAEASFLGVTDPFAVPSIVKAFGSGSPEDQALAVRLLGQVDAPSASRALASMAVFGSTGPIRRSAAETLAGRDPRECSPWLLALLRDPIKYEVKPVGGPGSPGELYVRGKKANTRRFYSAPPPLLDLRPGDTFDLDMTGALVARRSVGHTTQPIAAALDPLYQGAPDMTGVGPKLAQGGLGAQGQQLGQQLGQNQKTNSSLMGKMQAASPRALGGGSMTTPVQAEIPLGQMIIQAQQQAAFARQKLQEDVATLERYNADVEQVNARAKMALKVASGEDRDDWPRWWVELTETSTVAPPRSRAVEAVEPKPLEALGTRARMASFAGGTPAWTRAGVRPIEDLRAGDLVLTQDTSTGALAFGPVLTTRRIEAGMTRAVEVGGSSIVATDLERFWVAGRGWVPLGDLKPGDPIRAVDGLARVGVVGEPKAQPTYQVMVGERRGIFVGKAGLLAHDDRVNNPAPGPFDATPGPSADRDGRPD